WFDARSRNPCRTRADLRQCEAHRSHWRNPRTQYRPLPGRRGDLRRPRKFRAPDARADGRSSRCATPGSQVMLRSTYARASVDGSLGSIRHSSSEGVQAQHEEVMTGLTLSLSKGEATA